MSRLGTVFLLVGLVLLAAAGTALGAEPSPTPMIGVDPRTGPMPSLTGNSALAAIVVILLGVGTAIVTALVIRVLPKRS